MYASTAIHPTTLTLAVTIAAPSGFNLTDTTTEVLLVSTEQKQRYKL